MKITVLGGAGLRTPLLVQALIRRQDTLQLDELSLMDIDGERLELVGLLTRGLEKQARFKITRSKDPRQALAQADFVISTFRVGNMEARIIDESVPLSLGYLGQETTGAGGFAMGLRTIPVLRSYIEQMKELCPQAWLINFANPSGMLAEMIVNHTDWRRAVGICDGPSTLHAAVSSIINAPPGDVFLDYFGLNHLGWIRGVFFHQEDYLPQLLDMISTLGKVPGLPFDAGLVTSLGLIPCEYLHYYYDRRRAVEDILQAEESRAEMLLALNQAFFSRLQGMQAADDESLSAAYRDYLLQRGKTYFQDKKTPIFDLDEIGDGKGEGYAGVALDVIEALSGGHPRRMILNIPNHGAIAGMAPASVVEIPAWVEHDAIHPLAVGEIPAHCLGLMLQVKAYEELTIAAAIEESYAKAHLALSIHPLISDRRAAKAILDEYIQEHAPLLSRLI